MRSCRAGIEGKALPTGFDGRIDTVTAGAWVIGTIGSVLLDIAWWDWPAEDVINSREYFHQPVEAFAERFG